MVARQALHMSDIRPEPHFMMSTAELKAADAAAAEIAGRVLFRALDEALLAIARFRADVAEHKERLGDNVERFGDLVELVFSEVPIIGVVLEPTLIDALRPLAGPLDLERATNVFCAWLLQIRDNAKIELL